MRFWDRPWYDWVVEIVVGLAFLGAPLVIGVLNSADPLLVTGVTGGMVCGGMFFIAQYESWRSRFRQTDTLEGRALIEAVDKWLREDFHRGPTQLEGYSHAIEVSSGEFKMWVGVEANRNNLVFIGARRDHAGSFAALGDAEAELIREIALEVARLGVYYRVRPDPPFTIEFWDVLPVDHTLTSTQVLEKVIRINQIDAVVQLVAQQALLAAPLVAGATPDVSEWRGSWSGPIQSQAVPNTEDYRTQ